MKSDTPTQEFKQLLQEAIKSKNLSEKWNDAAVRFLPLLYKTFHQLTNNLQNHEKTTLFKNLGINKYTYRLISNDAFLNTDPSYASKCFFKDLTAKKLPEKKEIIGKLIIKFSHLATPHTRNSIFNSFRTSANEAPKQNRVYTGKRKTR